MLSKKTHFGEEMEIQTEYKWTTGCGFIWWLVFLMIFFFFASFKYDRLSTIKTKSSYQSMEPLKYIPIVVNSTGLTPKFKIKFDITNVTGSDYQAFIKAPSSNNNDAVAAQVCTDLTVRFKYSKVSENENYSNMLKYLSSCKLESVKDKVYSLII